MYIPISAQYCNSTTRQNKIRIVDEWGIVKYNATRCAVITANWLLKINVICIQFRGFFICILIFVCLFKTVKICYFFFLVNYYLLLHLQCRPYTMIRNWDWVWLYLIIISDTWDTSYLRAHYVASGDPHYVIIGTRLRDNIIIYDNKLCVFTFSERYNNIDIYIGMFCKEQKSNLIFIIIW
jgi:hypothetical protein